MIDQILKKQTQASRKLVGVVRSAATKFAFLVTVRREGIKRKSRIRFGSGCSKLKLTHHNMDDNADEHEYAEYREGQDEHIKISIVAFADAIANLFDGAQETISRG